MNFSIPDIFKLQFELAEFLYQVDPLSIGTVENNIRDEYSVEATKIINRIAEFKLFVELNNKADANGNLKWAENFECVVKDEVKQVFREMFYPLQIANADVELITKFIVAKLNNAH